MQRVIEFLTAQAAEMAALRKEVDALKAEFHQVHRPSRAENAVNTAAPAVSQQAERAAAAEPVSAPAAPAAARGEAPTESHRDELTARMRKVLKSGAETVESVKAALRGGMVVRPSAVTTWAEYDALSKLFDSVNC